jgi:hypothetical protein
MLKKKELASQLNFHNTKKNKLNTEPCESFPDQNKENFAFKSVSEAVEECLPRGK